MNKYQRPPINKIGKALIPRQDSASPLKKASNSQIPMVFNSPTPAPMRSPSPTRDKKSLAKKGSLSRMPFNKIDLRKGIFSNKHNFTRNSSEKNISNANRAADSPVPCNKNNKYHFLSKEFKININLLEPRKPELVEDSSGLVIGNSNMKPYLYSSFSHNF